MEITRELVLHIAKLARLKISEDEIQSYINYFKEILGYFEKLKEVDTTNIQPMTHTLDIKNVWREDIWRESYDRNAILKNAPDKEEGFFKVPKVIE